VSVALVIQHANRICRIILSSVVSLAVLYFSTLSHKRHNFPKKKVIGHKMCVLIFSKNFIWSVSHSAKNSARYIINVHRSSCKEPLFLLVFIKLLIFSTDFRKILIWNFMKIRPVRAELFCVDRHDVANSRFLHFFRKRLKTEHFSRGVHMCFICCANTNSSDSPTQH
jgi:hypothetical protein